MKQIRFSSIKKSVIYLIVGICVVYLGIFFLNLLSIKKKASHKENFATNDMDGISVKMFFVDWCGHCKTTKPGFKQFMEQKNGSEVKNKKVKIEMINCEENERNAKLASKYQVKGYPTIIAESNGKKHVYENADRTANGFSKWLESLF